jgi:Lrp/AsnC family leucine-responsive transcriptional regulator
MLKLDLKDRKILYELDLNSRQPYHDIARKVGLSKDAVIYRISKLKEEGIIQRFHTIIDNGKLGLIPFRLYLKLMNATPEKEAEILEFLKKERDVIWLMSIDGEYDIGLAIYVKSIKEMNLFWKKLLAKYRNFIAKRWLTIYTKVSYYPRAYLLDLKENYKEYLCFTEPEEMRLGEEEIEILKLLAADARVSVVDIARRVKITPKTAAKKIHELEKRQVIVGYRTMFDLERLGYQYFKVHISVTDLTPEKERAIKGFLLQHPNIVYDNEILGGYDLEIEIQVKTLTELREIMGEMKRRFTDAIINYTYMLHKYVFFPLEAQAGAKGS